MKSAPQPRFARRPTSALLQQHRCQNTEAAPLTSFRINTCKSVSKQRTLTPFKMNTYEKPRGRGEGAFHHISLLLARCLYASVANPFLPASSTPRFHSQFRSV